MDIHEAAAKLDGICFGDERGNLPLYQSMAKAGLVAVFAGDDRTIFVKGAIEGNHQGSGPLYLYEEGLLQSDPEGDDCPYLSQIRVRAIAIEAIHQQEPGQGQPHWSFKCLITHAAFDTITSDFENPYSRGLVIHISDIPGFPDAVE